MNVTRFYLARWCEVTLFQLGIMTEIFNFLLIKRNPKKSENDHVRDIVSWHTIKKKVSSFLVPACVLHGQPRMFIDSVTFWSCSRSFLFKSRSRQQLSPQSFLCFLKNSKNSSIVTRLHYDRFLPNTSQVIIHQLSCHHSLWCEILAVP